jgi:hypothetical protein
VDGSSIEVKTYRSVTELRFELRDGGHRATWIYDPRETGIFFVVGPPVWDDGTPMERSAVDALYARVAGARDALVEYDRGLDTFVLRRYAHDPQRTFLRVCALQSPTTQEVGAGFADWLCPGRTARVEVELRAPLDASGAITYGPMRLRVRPETARWLDDGAVLTTAELDALRARLRSVERLELLLTSVYFEVEP